MPELPFAVIAVRGSDAFEFLQGQLTNDLRRLADDSFLRTAWCNPKGRVITLARARQSSAAIELTVAADLAENVVHRLKMFRFRAKAEFDIRAATAHDVGVDADTDRDSLLREQIRRGVPEIFRDQSEKFTPHMLNLDLLDAISFDKGCYTGQEIVARTHFRGATRRRTLRYTSSEPVTPGAKVHAGDRAVGEVLNAQDTDLLAVLPLDVAEADLTIGSATLTRQSLPYALAPVA